MVAFVAPDGSLALVPPGGSEPADGWVVRNEYYEQVLVVERMCQLSVGHRWDSARFVLPRHGVHNFWRITCIYELAGLAVAGGKSSVWLHKAWPAWERLFEKARLAGHLLKSKPYRDPGEAPMRCLPWPAASTTGLLFLIGVFVAGNKKIGGLASPENKQHVDQCLGGQVFVSVSGGAPQHI